MNINQNLSYEIPQGHSYSPKYLVELYRKMVAQQADSIEDAFDTKNKNKTVDVELEGIKKVYSYKQIFEAHKCALLCLAINKHYSTKYELIFSDKPDIILINQNHCLLFEVYEAYEFGREGIREEVNIIEQINKLKEKKFEKSKTYPQNTNLLIRNRIPSIQYNISDYIRLINQYDRGFSGIRLGINNNDIQSFYEVFPNIDTEIIKIDFSITRDKAYLY